MEKSLRRIWHSARHSRVLYGGWAHEPGQAGKRQQEERYKVQGLAVIRSARGARHPEMATQHNNLAVMKARRGDRPGAATDMERAVAIMLSLALSEHDSMPS